MGFLPTIRLFISRMLRNVGKNLHQFIYFIREKCRISYEQCERDQCNHLGDVMVLLRSLAVKCDDDRDNPDLQQIFDLKGNISCQQFRVEEIHLKKKKRFLLKLTNYIIC